MRKHSCMNENRKAVKLAGEEIVKIWLIVVKLPKLSPSNLLKL